MTRNVIRTCQGEEPTNTRSAPWAAWADALFVSMLQSSDRPSTGQARQATAAARAPALPVRRGPGRCRHG